jgi:hypothetical protein
MSRSRLKLIRVIVAAALIATASRAGARGAVPVAPDEPILIGQCVGNCLHDKLVQEYAFYLIDAANYSKLAIRLCSNERFEIAIAKASSNLNIITQELKERSRINPDEIDLLLSKGDCSPEVPGRVTTQFWAIPASAPMPEHYRRIKLGGASTTVIRKEDNRSRLTEFVKQLRKEPDSFGVVIGSFFRQPSRLLKSRVREAERYLKSRTDLKARSAAALVPYGIIYTGHVEPTEPDFLIIRINPSDQ